MCVPPGHTYLCVYPWRPHIHYNKYIREPNAYIYVCLRASGTHICMCACVPGAHTIYVCAHATFIYVCVRARLGARRPMCLFFVCLLRPPVALQKAGAGGRRAGQQDGQVASRTASRNLAPVVPEPMFTLTAIPRRMHRISSDLRS